jgi:hypothetical protein
LYADNGFLQKNKTNPNRPFDLEWIISQLPTAHLPQPIKQFLYMSEDGQKLVYERVEIETDVKNLQLLLDLLCDLAEAYPVMVALGGEIVPTLHPLAMYDSVVQQVAVQLLTDIGRETTQRLKPQTTRLLCPECLVYCGMHSIKLPGRKFITYYGCQICGQSREFLSRDQYWLVVVLDNRLAAKRLQDGSTLRINWLTYHKLFDFDKVEIVQATDEEVERFVVQIGNSSDPGRQAYYKQIRCVVASASSLSENSFRVLQHVFGRVEVKEVVDSQG